MYEIRFFDDDEKNDMYKMFKKLMKTNREIVELLLDANEKKDAEFLNSFFIQWLNMKNDLKTYINKMKESWEKETTIEEDIGYFG